MSVQAKPEQKFEPRRVEVGIRELQKNLSKYVHEASLGSEIVITSHGKPLASLRQNDMPPKIAEMIAKGLAKPPARPKGSFLPKPIKLKSGATVSDLIKEQRR